MTDRPTVWYRIRGPAVSELQAILTEKGCSMPAPGYEDEDGWFGPQTETAVKVFQSRLGLQETGIVDEYLWGLLVSDDGKPFPSGS